MPTRQTEDFDKKFDDGDEDVIDDLDLSSAKRLNHQQKRVNVDFPQWVVDALDKEADRVGVTRQSVIKMWLVERLEEQTSHRQALV